MAEARLESTAAYDLRVAILTLLVDAGAAELPASVLLSDADAQVLVRMGGITCENWIRLAEGWAPNLATPA